MIKKISVVLCGLLLVLSAAILTGCGGDEKNSTENKSASDAGKEIRVGVAGPFTGAIAETGTTIKNAVLLAEEQINQAGGINGKQVKLDLQDDKADPKEAAAVANKFASDKSILAVVGHYTSSTTLAGAPIYNRVGLPHIGIGCTSPAITSAGPYTYRVLTSDAYDGEYVANWMIEEGFKNIAVAYENDDYGKGLADVFKAKIESLNGKVVAMEPYNLGETKDFSAILTKFKAAKPDSLFIAGQYNEAAMLLKQGKGIGFKLPVFGSNGLYSDALIKLGGADVEGLKCVGSFHQSAPSQEAKDFIAAYKAKYNQEPDIWAAYAYDAANILFAAIKNGGEDREKINEYLTTLKDFKGATGVTTFDENGDCMKEPLKLVIQNGKFELYIK
ncbi:ABC transporter substrate-binding protein [Desulfotruncus alcoholivorax]|uniref:ABC transporter substrate-binding protein n=1 Tax=Desulfotruncus alcoholivorax TaxID=265477 RepID=UPI0003F68ACB|nr:ABC transporter substrate-binding protein [Desulfotruncus alcoholivorax]